MKYYTSKTPLQNHVPFFTINEKENRTYVGNFVLSTQYPFTIYDHHFNDYNDLLGNLNLFEECTITSHPELFI